MPETADVGDAGTVFAPASGAHKRPRIERIHQTVNKQNPPCKRICLGGGRVSGRSRENLISGLISRADLVLQQPVEVTPVAEDHGRATQRHLPASFRRPGATVDPAIVRRYAEMRAETDAQVRAYRLRHPHTFFAPGMRRVSTATAQVSQAMQSEVIAEESGTQALHTQEPATPSHPAGSEEVVTPAPVVQVVQFTPSGPVTLTAEQAVRRYSIIHAENEAARARWDAETEEAAQLWANSLPDTNQSEVDAGASLTQSAAAQEVVAPPPSVAQDVAPVTQAPVTTQTGSLRLRSYAYDDTHSGYYDDYDLDYPLI